MRAVRQLTPTQYAIEVLRSYLEHPPAAVGYPSRADAYEAAAVAWGALRRVCQVLDGWAHYPGDYVRRELWASIELFADARTLAIRRGADDLAYASEVLGEQTAETLDKVGGSMVDAFHAFWGGSPRDFFREAMGGALVGAVIVAAAAPFILRALGSYALSVGQGFGAAAPFASAVVPIKLGAA